MSPCFLIDFSMSKLEQRWYSGPLPIALLPIEGLYRAITAVRRLAYRGGLFRSYALPVPVVIVGNISVGGTGKTPLTTYLVDLLKANGYTPGIITRGYGGKAKQWPQLVTAYSDSLLVGDEPVLLAQRCACPVVAGPNRVEAGLRLLNEYSCNIILSDDGLQHYRLRRQVEIVVLDGERRFGNEHCLPVGPLREPLSRLSLVDFVVANGKAMPGEVSMQLQSGDAISLLTGGTEALLAWRDKTVHAVAGIGNPLRFFNMLRSQGLDVIEHAFPDHHQFCEVDICFDDGLPVLMTEKDAVKCMGFCDETHWAVPVEARLSTGFSDKLLALLAR